MTTRGRRSRDPNGRGSSSTGVRSAAPCGRLSEALEVPPRVAALPHLGWRPAMNASTRGLAKRHRPSCRTLGSWRRRASWHTRSLDTSISSATSLVVIQVVERSSSALSPSMNTRHPSGSDRESPSGEAHWYPMSQKRSPIGAKGQGLLKQTGTLSWLLQLAPDSSTPPNLCDVWWRVGQWVCGRAEDSAQTACSVVAES